MIKLIYIDHAKNDKWSVPDSVKTIRMVLHGDANLDECLLAFNRFLLACGYNFEGNIVIEENEPAVLTDINNFKNITETSPELNDKF